MMPALFVIAVVTVMITFKTSGAQDCAILTKDGMKWNKSEYFITTSAENYSISATCRCVNNTPYWTLIDGSHLQLEEKHYCDGDSCPGSNTKHFRYRDLNSFTVTKSAYLLCGNNDMNYAPAIAITLIKTDEASKKCLSPSSSSSSSHLSQMQSTSENHISSSHLISSIGEIVSSSEYPLSTIVPSSSVAHSSLSPSSYTQQPVECSCSPEKQQLITTVFTTTCDQHVLTTVPGVLVETTTTFELPTIESQVQIFRRASIGLGIAVVVMSVIIVVLITLLMAVSKRKSLSLHKEQDTIANENTELRLRTT